MYFAIILINFICEFCRLETLTNKLSTMLTFRYRCYNDPFNQNWGHSGQDCSFYFAKHRRGWSITWFQSFFTILTLINIIGGGYHFSRFVFNTCRFLRKTEFYTTDFTCPSVALTRRQQQHYQYSWVPLQSTDYARCSLNFSVPILAGAAPNCMRIGTQKHVN